MRTGALTYLMLLGMASGCGGLGWEGPPGATCPSNDGTALVRRTSADATDTQSLFPWGVDGVSRAATPILVAILTAAAKEYGFAIEGGTSARRRAEDVVRLLEERTGRPGIEGLSAANIGRIVSMAEIAALMLGLFERRSSGWHFVMRPWLARHSLESGAIDGFFDGLSDLGQPGLQPWLGVLALQASRFWAADIWGVDLYYLADAIEDIALPVHGVRISPPFIRSAVQGWLAYGKQGDVFVNPTMLATMVLSAPSGDAVECTYLSALPQMSPCLERDRGLVALRVLGSLDRPLAVSLLRSKIAWAAKARDLYFPSLGASTLRDPAMIPDLERLQRRHAGSETGVYAKAAAEVIRSGQCSSTEGLLKLPPAVVDGIEVSRLREICGEYAPWR